MDAPIDSSSRVPAVARPSGIPKTSRLPVLKPTSANTSHVPSTNTKAEKPATGRRPLGNTLRASQSRDAPSKPRVEDVFKKPAGRAESQQSARGRTVTSSSNGTSNGDGATAASSSSSKGLSRATTSTSDQQSQKPRKGPRPSLSDRTIESLANIPATPRDRRRSSFFSPQSPMTQSSRSRPGSAMERNRRPGSSDSSTPQVHGRVPGGARATSPVKQTSAMGATTRPTADRLASRPTTSRPSARVPFSGSKTMTARVPASRPGLAGVFSQPKSSRSTVPSAAKVVRPPAGAPDTSPRKVSSSSAALRDQIRQAKAQHRRVSEKGVEVQPNYDLVEDPFNQNPRNSQSELSRRIGEARLEGRLNISALGLTEMPPEVLKMYVAHDDGEDTVAWGEFVDLVKLTAADNEIQTLPDEMFPDVDEEDNLPQFGGLETIDLHGNLLRTIPLGLQRLERLTLLNLVNHPPRHV